MLSDSALILASRPLRVVCRSACARSSRVPAQVNVELMGQAQRLIGAIVGDLLQLADQIGNAGAQRTRNIVTQDQRSSITVSRLTGWR